MLTRWYPVQQRLGTAVDSRNPAAHLLTGELYTGRTGDAPNSFWERSNRGDQPGVNAILDESLKVPADGV